MRILVSGGSGQLARALQLVLTGHELILPEEKDFDLADPGAMLRTLHVIRPDVVLNAGAYTAVDAAEADEAQALRVNGTAVGVLAKACNEHRALLVQISTDYVFEGNDPRPRRETDPTGPRTAYGRTKLAGEGAAREAHDHLIVRTSWLYEAWGKNFLNTMLRLGAEGRPLKVVDDQHGSPTSCRALARQLQVALDGGWRGLVHVTCAGSTTWYHFARTIFRMACMNAEVQPCTSAEYPVPAPRPAWSVLDNSGRLAHGEDLMPSWEDALAEVLAERLLVSK